MAQLELVRKYKNFNSSPSRSATNRENCNCTKLKALMEFLRASGDHTLFDAPGSLPLNRPDFRHYRRGFLAAATKV